MVRIGRLVLLLFFLYGGLELFAQSRDNQLIVNTPESAKSRVKALVFGISNYKKLPIEKQLEYAHSDALGFYRFLMSRPDIVQPENITALFNADAGGLLKIRTLLYDALVRNARKGDLVIIYFAGHGDVQRFSKDKEEAFLLFHNVERNSDFLAPGNDALPVRDLQHYISLAPEGVKVLLITDACRSGKVLGGERETSLFLTALSNEWANTIKLVSCQPNQLSYEGKEWGDGHGVFSHYLLWALKGVADSNNDNVLQLFEIYDFVKRNVQTDTDNNQIPKVLGDESLKLFAVDAKMKKEANMEFAPKISPNFTNALSSVMMQMITNRAGVFGENYFYGLSASQTFLLDQFTSAVNNHNLLPGDVSQQAVNADFTIVDNRTFLDTDFELYSTALSPDGKFIAMGGAADWVFVIDAESGAQLRQLKHRGVLEIYFSPNGKMLFTGGWDNRLKVWEMPSGKLLVDELALDNDIRDFAFANNIPLLATAGDGSNITLYNSETFKMQQKWPKLHSGRVTSSVFTPDDAFLVTAGVDGKILVRNLSSGSVHKSIAAKVPVNDLLIHRASNVLYAVSSNGSVLTVDYQQGKIVHEKKVSEYPLEVMTGDKLCDVIYLGGKQRLIFGYDVNTREIVSEIPVERGVNDLSVNVFANKLVASTWGKQLQRVKFKQLMPKSTSDASVLHSELIARDDFSHLHGRLTNFYRNALSEYASEVIQSFVNADADLPGFDKIQRARRCLLQIDGFESNTDFVQELNHINLELIDIYEALSVSDYKNISDAIAKLEALMQQGNEAAYMHNTLGTLYKKLHKLKEAQTSIAKAADLLPDWSEPLINMGEIYFADGRYDASSLEFRKVMRMHPQNYKGYLGLAEVYAFLGKTDSAVDLANQATRRASKSEIVHCRAARIALSSGNIDFSELLLRTAFSFDSASGYAQLLMAQNYVYRFLQYFDVSGKVNFQFLQQSFDYVKSAGVNTELADNLNITTAEIYLAAFDVYRRAGGALKPRILETCKVESSNKLLFLAFDHFDKVYKKNPLNIEAVWGLMRSKEAGGNIDKALWYANQLERLMPSSPVPSYYRGRILLKNSQFGKGRKVLVEAIEIDERFLPAYRHLFQSAEYGKVGLFDKWFKGGDVRNLPEFESRALKVFGFDVAAKTSAKVGDLLYYLP